MIVRKVVPVVVLLAVAVVIGVAVSSDLAKADVYGPPPTGCRTFTYNLKHKSKFGTTTLFRMHVRMETCFRNGEITTAGASCWVDDVYTFTVQNSDCSIQTYRFGWNGNERGGFHAQGSAHFANCINVSDLTCAGNGGTMTMLVWGYANGFFDWERRT